MDTGGARSQIRGHLVARLGVTLRGGRERGVSAGGGEGAGAAGLIQPL